MKIQVVAVGNRTPEWAREAYDDYGRRLPGDWHLELKTVKAADRQEGKPSTSYQITEAQRIEAALKGYVGCKVVLDERGKSVRTEELLKLIEVQNAEKGGIAFIIGGPDGLASDLKKNCDAMIQLSALTLPHVMAKVVLLEQIYRCAAIASNHPYHRD